MLIPRLLAAFFVALAASLLLAVPAKATIFFQSDVGPEESCVFVSGDPCVPQTVTPHPVWTLSGLGTYDWVSGRPSGFGQPGFVERDPVQPVMRYTERMHLPGTQADVWEIILTWLADDTTLVPKGDDVPFTMIQGIAPNLQQGDGGCAVGPVGCEPYENGVARIYATGGGSLNISFEVLQLGLLPTTFGNPFGLAYFGEANIVVGVDPDVTSTIPLPPPALMLGGAIVGLAYVGRRQLRQAA